MFSNKLTAAFLIFVLLILGLIFWQYQAQQKRIAEILKRLDSRASVSLGKGEADEIILNQKKSGGLTKEAQRKLEDLINAEIREKLKENEK